MLENNSSCHTYAKLMNFPWILHVHQQRLVQWKVVLRTEWDIVHLSTSLRNILQDTRVHRKHVNPTDKTELEWYVYFIHTHIYLVSLCRITLL